ncbi:hypothetical protein QJQ45_011684 [Haematococcus lacustris]|nr:hypothetical protein QJQ45_011684 [Haematococcus lacustris]
MDDPWRRNRRTQPPSISYLLDPFANTLSKFEMLGGSVVESRESGTAGMDSLLEQAKALAALSLATEGKTLSSVAPDEQAQLVAKAIQVLLHQRSQAQQALAQQAGRRRELERLPSPIRLHAHETRICEMYAFNDRRRREAEAELMIMIAVAQLEEEEAEEEARPYDRICPYWKRPRSYKALYPNVLASLDPQVYNMEFHLPRYHLMPASGLHRTTTF